MFHEEERLLWTHGSGDGDDDGDGGEDEDHDVNDDDDDGDDDGCRKLVLTTRPIQLPAAHRRSLSLTPGHRHFPGRGHLK